MTASSMRARIPDLERDTGSITFIGTATMLIRYAGFTILTDPNFVHRHTKIPIGYGLHATRLTDPAIEIDDLPPYDFVLLSHFHADHFDEVAEERIDKAMPIVTTPQAAGELRDRGFTATVPLDTWESYTRDRDGATLRVTATPGWHGPAIVGALLPKVMGSIVEFETPDRLGLRLYITGDTLMVDDLKEIPVRYPTIDLAILHLGGTKVLGILVTMDDKQGVEMIRLVNPKRAIPVHYNDYDLFKSPLSDFQAAVQEAGLADRVHYLAHGDSYTFRVPFSG